MSARKQLPDAIKASDLEALAQRMSVLAISPVQQRYAETAGELAEAVRDVAVAVVEVLERVEALER